MWQLSVVQIAHVCCIFVEPYNFSWKGGSLPQRGCACTEKPSKSEAFAYNFLCYFWPTQSEIVRENCSFFSQQIQGDVGAAFSSLPFPRKKNQFVSFVRSGRMSKHKLPSCLLQFFMGFENGFFLLFHQAFSTGHCWVITWYLVVLCRLKSGTPSPQ